MIGFIIQFLIILTMHLLLVQPRVGLCLYLACYFLIPSLELSFIGLEPVETSVLFALIFIMASTGGNKYTKIDYKPFMPFLLLYSALFFLTFFSSQFVPLGFSVKYFVRYIIQTFIIPICIYTMICRHRGLLETVNTTLLVVIAVAVIYGLILTLTPGENAYLDMLSKDINLPEIHLGSGEGRLFGAISSVFMHPMSYGIMLGFSICYLIYANKYIGLNHYVFLNLLILILLSIVFCGVRSSLAALMGTGAIFLLLKRRFKLLVEAVLLLAIIMTILSFFPALYEYVMSLFQMESVNVSGSSFSMRFEQLAASQFEIRDNPIFGNGYAWHSYYIWQNGGYGHPILHGWESLLFVALTDSGYAGVLVWVIFVIYFFVKFKDVGILCLFSFFMFYMLGTGTFGENMFYIFYVLFLIAQRQSRIKQLIKN